MLMEMRELCIHMYLLNNNHKNRRNGEIRFMIKIKNLIKKLIPDRVFISYQYKNRLGKKLNLKHPKTFDEKLQWLKLHDRNPLYTKLVDKYEVKKYIASIIGDEYVIPTIGVWDSFDEIDFSLLPRRFVLKCTHDSGSTIVIKDKENIDYLKLKSKMEWLLNNNYYLAYREWPYKNVKPRIIAEKYIEDEKDKELRDYKLYCFNGEPYRLLVITNRYKGEAYFDYFDMDYKHLELKNHWHPNACAIPHKPIKFEEMKNLARKLSCDIPHVRVDFYEANGQIYFGEMTFFAMGGYLILHPDQWEEEWGNKIVL